MGKFKEFVKKWGSVGIFAAGSIAMAGIIYYKTRPEGVTLKAEADGVLTAEEEKSALDFLNSNEPIQDYSPALRAFVNDFDVFAAKEFEARGLPSYRFDEDINILIANSDKIDSVCGEWGAGCWGDINSTIYLENNSNPFWIATAIPHEIGHSFRQMGDSPELDELSSESNEFYTKLKMYCFDKKIGIEYINETLNLPDNRCKPNEKHLPYILGEIGFLVQANKTKGDLERTLYNILNDRQDNGIIEGIASFFTGAEGCLECDTQNALKQYSCLSNVYYSEYRKLIEQPHFVEGMLRHRDMAETHELLEYMRLRLDFSIAYSTATADNNKISFDEIYRGLGVRADLFILTAANSELKELIQKKIIQELSFTFCGNRNAIDCDYPK